MTTLSTMYLTTVHCTTLSYHTMTTLSTMYLTTVHCTTQSYHTMTTLSTMYLTTVHCPTQSYHTMTTLSTTALTSSCTSVLQIWPIRTHRTTWTRSRLGSLRTYVCCHMLPGFRCRVSYVLLHFIGFMFVSLTLDSMKQ